MQRTRTARKSTLNGGGGELTSMALTSIRVRRNGMRSGNLPLFMATSKQSPKSMWSICRESVGSLVSTSAFRSYLWSKMLQRPGSRMVVESNPLLVYKHCTEGEDIEVTTAPTARLPKIRTPRTIISCGIANKFCGDSPGGCARRCLLQFRCLRRRKALNRCGPEPIRNLETELYG